MAALDPLLPSLCAEPLSAEASHGAGCAEARLLCSLGPTGRPSSLRVLPLPHQHVVPLPLPAYLDPAVRLKRQLHVHLPSGLSEKPWAQFTVDKSYGIVISTRVPWSLEFLCMFFAATTSVGEAAQRGSGLQQAPTPCASVSQSLWLGHFSPVFKKRKERGEGKE